MGEVAAERTDRAADSRGEAARSLASARRRLFVFSTAAALAAPFALWASGISASVWAAVAALSMPETVRLATYVVFMLSILVLPALPFSWYGGFVLAHRFNLSRQSLPAWLADWLKAVLVGLLLGSGATLAFYGANDVAGARWWLLFGAAACMATLLLTFVAPYLIVPLFYRMRPLQDHEVVEAVRRLGAAARAEVRDVCTLDFSRKTVEANAAVIGLGRSRRVVLADTLLSEFSLPEVKSVVAHEIGHHVHRDVLRLLATHCALMWAGLMMAAFAGEALLANIGARGGFQEPSNLPLLLLGVELFGLLALPLANSLSRRLEASADVFALDLTRDPGAFASAMRKLADQNLVETEPPRWAELLLYTHPPIKRRIRTAEARERGQAA